MSKNINSVLNLIKKKDYNQAIKVLNKYEKINNTDFKIYYLLATAYNEINNIDESINNLEKCINLNPKFIQGLENLAELNLVKGKIKKAEEIYLKILDLDKNNLLTIFKLTNINEKYLNEIKTNEIKSLINYNGISNEKKALGYFILAKIERKNKNYKIEIDYLDKSHKNFFNYRKNSNNQSLFYYSKIIPKFYNDILYSNNDIENMSKVTPIFIIGLPRSGSTLIESILQSNDEKIQSIGESSLINFSVVNQLRNLIFDKNFDINKFKFKLDLQPILKSLNSKLIESKILDEKKDIYFIDKSLENFFYIDLILKIFPKAKIINMNRDPKHSVIAIYQQLLTLTSWSHSISNITEYIDNYLNIINHYRNKYPDNIYDLSLVDLSIDPKSTTKSVFKFCGIKWNKSCLEYYKRKDLISKTASNLQIRKKIFKYDEEKFINYHFVYEKFEKKYSWLKKK